MKRERERERMGRKKGKRVGLEYNGRISFVST